MTFDDDLESFDLDMVARLNQLVGSPTSLDNVVVLLFIAVCLDWNRYGGHVGNTNGSCLFVVLLYGPLHGRMLLLCIHRRRCHRRRTKTQQITCQNPFSIQCKLLFVCHNKPFLSRSRPIWHHQIQRLLQWLMMCRVALVYKYEKECDSSVTARIAQLVERSLNTNLTNILNTCPRGFSRTNYGRGPWFNPTFGQKSFFFLVLFFCVHVYCLCHFFIVLCHFNDGCRVFQANARTASKGG